MSKKVPVSIQVIDEELIPLYATPFASGCDARAAIVEPLSVAPGKSAIVPTGIKVALPEGFEIQVRPRSGFAAKNQITVLNTPGTIDSDYRGEISVILMNHGVEEFIVTPKMRIAQLVLSPVIQAEFIRQESLSETLRGEGRFGHTGTN
ncbi:MAG: dUTP diphosphatase [Chlamydiae bacterium CG10_big_fil_rev_8_21_14_0_10_42_34]|nr:MAG: dUTP diphosphatase [Chlamydiae bacterium CG10_big_fil_rev_8_21_14_0_10_42_34]